MKHTSCFGANGYEWSLSSQKEDDQVKARFVRDHCTWKLVRGRITLLILLLSKTWLELLTLTNLVSILFMRCENQWLRWLWRWFTNMKARVLVRCLNFTCTYIHLESNMHLHYLTHFLNPRQLVLFFWYYVVFCT